MDKFVPSNQSVISYYQTSQWLYRLFCYDSNTLGMHYGFWEKGTRNRQEAIENENDAVIQYGRIQKDNRVLDAGCGVGGTAIFIAKKTNAHVTGITLDPHQVRLAKQYAGKFDVADKTNFGVMDFMHLNFPSNHFDAVYGVESVGYAHPKETFLRGVYRILKPGGRLVVMEGYAAQKPTSSEAIKLLREIENNFHLAPVVTGTEFASLMKKVGFVEVSMVSKKKETTPSVEYFGKFGSRMMPIAKFLSFFPIPKINVIYQNARATRAVAKSYRKNLGEYYIHVGMKPAR